MITRAWSVTGAMLATRTDRNRHVPLCPYLVECAEHLPDRAVVHVDVHERGAAPAHGAGRERHSQTARRGAPVAPQAATRGPGSASRSPGPRAPTPRRRSGRAWRCSRCRVGRSRPPPRHKSRRSWVRRIAGGARTRSCPGDPMPSTAQAPTCATWRARLASDSRWSNLRTWSSSTAGSRAGRGELKALVLATGWKPDGPAGYRSDCRCADPRRRRRRHSVRRPQPARVLDRHHAAGRVLRRADPLPAFTRWEPQDQARTTSLTEARRDTLGRAGPALGDTTRLRDQRGGLYRNACPALRVDGLPAPTSRSELNHAHGPQSRIAAVRLDAVDVARRRSGA